MQCPKDLLLSFRETAGTAHGDADRHSNVQNRNVTVRENFTLRATVTTGELFGIQ